MPVTNERYSFEEQKAVGADGENMIDEYLSEYYTLRKPPLDSEIRWKFDRFLINGQKRYTVEYKTDTVAGQSENLFIETISNTDTGAPGWALDSVAQVVCYLLKGTGRILFLDVVRIRMALPLWRVNCPSKAVQQDDGSYTHGLLVPIESARDEEVILAELLFS